MVNVEYSDVPNKMCNLFIFNLNMASIWPHSKNVIFVDFGTGYNTDNI